MSFLQWDLARKTGVKPAQTLTRSIEVANSATAATAQTFNIPLPRDHFIDAIIIAMGEDTNATADNVANLGTLADDLTGDMEVVLNGSVYPVKMTPSMCKGVSIMNKLIQATGYYRIDFKDPRVPDAKGLPSWLFSSAYLKVTGNAPASASYHHIGVTLLEEFYGGEDIEHAPLLVQKYMVHDKSAAKNTGWFKYEHERVHTIYGYVYEFDDGGTLEDPAILGFDNLEIVGRHPAGEDRILNITNLVALKEVNKQIYQQALPTGIVSVDFPNGYPTGKYSSIYSYYHIDTAAGTAAGIKVLERYVLGG